MEAGWRRQRRLCSDCNKLNIEVWLCVTGSEIYFQERSLLLDAVGNLTDNGSKKQQAKRTEGRVAFSFFSGYSTYMELGHKCSLLSDKIDNTPHPAHTSI